MDIIKAFIKYVETHIFTIILYRMTYSLNRLNPRSQIAGSKSHSQESKTP